jgi:hypothetical protein
MRAAASDLSNPALPMLEPVDDDRDGRGDEEVMGITATQCHRPFREK